MAALAKKGLDEVIKEKRDIAVTEAKKVKITSQKKFEAASIFLRDVINPMLKEIHSTFDPIVDKANAVVKEARKQRKRHLDPVESARDRIRNEQGPWQLEQERKVEVARKKKQEALRLKMEEEREKEAEALREAGMAKAAKELAAEPIIVPSVEVKAATPAVAGQSFREDWVYSVEDRDALVVWLWENHRELLLVDGKRFGAMIKAMKESAIPIPGITVTKKKIPVSRGM